MRVTLQLDCKIRDLYDEGGVQAVIDWLECERNLTTTPLANEDANTLRDAAEARGADGCLEWLEDWSEDYAQSRDLLPPRRRARSIR